MQIDIDLEKDLPSNIGSLFSKRCSIIDNVDLSKEELQNHLLSGPVASTKGKVLCERNEIAEAGISKKTIICNGYFTCDTHYLLEKKKLVKPVTKLPYRITVDVSKIFNIVMSVLITRDLYPEFKGLSNDDYYKAISQIFTGKIQQSIFDFYELKESDMLIGRYFDNLVAEYVCRSDFSKFIEEFLNRFLLAYHVIKLKIFSGLRKELVPVSLGYNELLFDSRFKDLRVFIKYRDIIDELPVSIEEY